jgi:hypothetical protein
MFIIVVEVGGEAANLNHFLVIKRFVMSTKGACARMETSTAKSDNIFLLRSRIKNIK